MRQRDAATVCSLLFPYGEHQPGAELLRSLRGLDSARGRSSYTAEVSDCTASFQARPSDLDGYRPLLGFSLRRIAVHGNVADASLRRAGGQALSALFVYGASEWRLGVGVQ